MIIGTLNDTSILNHLNPVLAQALQWVIDHRRDTFTPGQSGEICPGKVFAKYEAAAMGPAEKARLEAHRRFIDIHVPLTSEETIGWRPVCDLRNCVAPYDEEADIIFYGDAAQALIPVLPGQFAICFPEDAHAPNIGAGMHRKFCIKISIDI
ncbi:MAG: YhcH/YjgK/YiaL family protein [Muribaculaceae bacterium]|nr:YhcH/YjgK/YiaL family protein [Muribaculaceae bacterium]